MKRYLPATAAVLVLGLGIGALKNAMGWSYDSPVLFLLSAVSILIVGLLADRAVQPRR